MTLFLTSVASEAEAEIAIAGGADLIDFKDAAKGALGALEPEILRRRRLPSRAPPASAVTGDLPMVPESLPKAVERIASTGVDYVKIGLFDDSSARRLHRGASPLCKSSSCRRDVRGRSGRSFAYASGSPRQAFTARCWTPRKRVAGRLLERRNSAWLFGFVASCRERGLLTGSRRVARASRCAAPPAACAPISWDFAVRFVSRASGPPDWTRSGFARRDRSLGSRIIGREATRRRTVSIIGFSSARLCGRAARRLLARRSHLRSGFRSCPFASAPIGPSMRRRSACASTWRLSCSAAPHAPSDLRDVLSYDVITDAIRRIVAEGHVELVEVLAERVAGAVLGEPRVVKVTVRVEKLDTGPATVGVEITRENSRSRDLSPSRAGASQRFQRLSVSALNVVKLGGSLAFSKPLPHGSPRSGPEPARPSSSSGAALLPMRCGGAAAHGLR